MNTGPPMVYPKSFFQTAVPAYKKNDFGYTIGGRPFLREEEEGFFLVRVVELWDEYRAADGIPEVVLLVGRHCSLEELGGIKCVITDKLVNVAVKLAGARLGLDFNRAGTAAAILGAVVRGKDLEFGNR